MKRKTIVSFLLLASLVSVFPVNTLSGAVDSQGRSGSLGTHSTLDLWHSAIRPQMIGHSITIVAHDNTVGTDVSVGISEDGIPTGFSTPHTFGPYAVETHTFTVPTTDLAGHPFLAWSTGETSRTITVSSGGTFTAYYQLVGWPMFHHDLRHFGYSTSTAPSNNQTLWSYTTGDMVDSSPAVADGKVFVGSNDGKVYALDESTGSKLWGYATGYYVASSPAVADGKVFVGSNDSKVYALDESTGNLIWSYTTGSFIISSPAVADGKVFVGSDDGKVYALDESTGNLIWSYTTGGIVDSSAAIAGGKVFVGSGDHKVYALDENTGSKLWSYTTGYYVASSPAVADGKVFVGSWDNKVYALDENTGSKLWSYTTGGVISASSPAVAGGKVFVGSWDHKVYALDESTGSLIWSYTTGYYVDSSPAVADGKVFIGSDDGKVYAFSSAAPAGIVTISNTILEAAIQTGTGASGVGTYTIRTGANHPAPYQNVLYGGAALDPWSSYNTIKVYDTNREYVATTRGVTPDSGFSLVQLDSCNPTIDVQTSTVVRIHWTTLEHLRIFEEVSVQGTSMSDTRLTVSMSVVNNDTVAHTVGFRFLLDLMIDGWDGSWLRPSATGPWLDTETTWAPPTFSFWETTNYPYQPLFYMYGYYFPTPTEMTFASWRDSFYAAYLYTPSGKVIGSAEPNTGGAYDSAVLYYWEPYVLPPSGTINERADIPPPLRGGTSYDAAIKAHCITESADVNVPIVMDGSPTVYTTSHTFTALTGSHTFTVPNTDVYGHPFKQWSTGSTSTTITVSSGGTYTAYYEQPSYSVSVTVGAHGSSNLVSQMVSSGTTLNFVFTPDAGYHVSDVKVNGTSVGSGSTLSVTVTGDTTVAVSFAINTYTITASAGSGGSISPSGSITVNHGDTPTFTITPNAGYHVSDALVDGSSVGAVSSYTFLPVSASHTIVASFAINTYSVTIVAHDNTAGTDVSVGITEDGSSTGFNTPHTFTGLTGSHTVAVPSTDANGNPFTQWSTGQTSPTITVSAGVTYTAYYQAAPPTYNVTIAAHDNTAGSDVSVGITEDGSSTGFNTPHTFTGLSAAHTFAVPNTDASGNPFLNWSTGATTTTITVSSSGTYTAYYQASAYDVTIIAHCNTEGKDVSVSITQDGAPTGYNTPHTFTSLVGAHTFTVPIYDPSGHLFKQWSTGQTATMITISSGGAYTANYQAIMTQSVTISAYCLTDGTAVNVAIVEDGSPTGFNTPHTFTGFVGTHNFTVPSSDASGHPFLEWSTGENDTTKTVDSSGTFAAFYYQAVQNLDVGITQVSCSPPRLQESVGYWKFNEGTGSAVYDTSLRRNDGVIHGANYTSGKYQYGLAFDGLDDYVEIPDSPSLNGMDQLTVEAWIFMNESAQAVILSKWSAGKAYQLDTFGSNNSPGIKIWTSQGQASLYSSLTPDNITNQWLFLVATYDGASLNLYINGKLVSTTQWSGSINADTGPLVIGAKSGDHSAPFKGRIDEVKIDDKALSPYEIARDLGVADLQVDVTIQNLGTIDSPPFNVSVYANATLLGSMPIPALKVGQSQTMSFYFTMRAIQTFGPNAIKASIDLDDANLLNSEYLYGTIYIPLPGDINCDGRVGLADLVLLAHAYGSRIGDPLWNPDADLDLSRRINLGDLVILAAYYGKRLS